MTSDQVRGLVESYRATFLEHAQVELRFPPNGLLPSRREAAAHALFMCKEIAVLLDEGKIEKAMRRLGWVQCTLWVFGLRSIGDLKGDNR